jgi:hypothetical protein
VHFLALCDPVVGLGCLVEAAGILQPIERAREGLTEITPQRLQGAQGRDRRGLGAQDPRAEP